MEAGSTGLQLSIKNGSEPRLHQLYETGKYRASINNRKLGSTERLLIIRMRTVPGVR